MKTSFNRTHSARDTYKSDRESELIAYFNRHFSDSFDDDFDTEFVPNRVDHAPPVSSNERLDDCDDWANDSASAGNADAAQDPFENDLFDETWEKWRHEQVVKKLLLTFIDERQSATAADICGPNHWNRFNDDEKRRAEYLIAELIAALRLPLMADSDQSYPAPRRYFFI